MKNKFWKIFSITPPLIIGLVLGGHVFSDTQPRSFLKLHDCRQTCLNTNELAGLIGSVGIQRASGLMPKVVKETEKTMVIVHPKPRAKYHYVIIPKKDIKNIEDITPEDLSYLADAFALAGELIRESGITKYRLVTNGPGYQSVTYLHFHLAGRE